MNVKKEVVIKISELLNNEISKIDNEIRRQKKTIKKLVETQTILKREKTKLCHLVSVLQKDIKE